MVLHWRNDGENGVNRFVLATMSTSYEAPSIQFLWIVWIFGTGKLSYSLIGKRSTPAWHIDKGIDCLE